MLMFQLPPPHPFLFLLLSSQGWGSLRFCWVWAFSSLSTLSWNTWLTSLIQQSPCRWSTAAAAAAPAKSLQSCSTLWDPIDGSPPGSPVPGILQARTLEWVAVSFSNAWKWKVKGKSLSRVWLFATPWTAAYQAPPSMGFSRQKYWSGVPSPFPRRSTNTFNSGFPSLNPIQWFPTDLSKHQGPLRLSLCKVEAHFSSIITVFFSIVPYKFFFNGPTII